MESTSKDSRECIPTKPAQLVQETLTNPDSNKYGWRVVNNILEAVKFTFDSVSNNENKAVVEDASERKNNEPDRRVGEVDNVTVGELQMPRDLQDTQIPTLCQRSCQNSVPNVELGESPEMQQELKKKDALDSGIGSLNALHNNATESTSSIRSIGSFVCRICHNAEQPERLVSPCLCKGSLTYVHTYCLEHWISTSGKTTCELCQFRYKTIQTLRYTCLQSLRMWYSHSMSRRALQEDCQMFSLLTLVAFGIVGTIIVGIQYYIVQEKNTMATMARVWTKGWLLFFLLTTFTVYFINVYMIARGQLAPWYRWWQSAREIKLILENRKSVHSFRSLRKSEGTQGAMAARLQDAFRTVPIAEEEVAMGTVFLYVEDNENDGRRHALVPMTSDNDGTPAPGINNQQQQHQHLHQQQQQQHTQQQECQPQDNEQQRQQQDNRNQQSALRIDI